jgi:hypothetical protein
MTFADKLHSDIQIACAEAQIIADQNECPCGVWGRDGWYTACELAPELIDPNPEDAGWSIWAVVDPTGWDMDPMSSVQEQS